MLKLLWHPESGVGRSDVAQTVRGAAGKGICRGRRDEFAHAEVETSTQCEAHHLPAVSAVGRWMSQLGGFLRRAAERLQMGYLGSPPATHRVPQIPILLKPEPEVSRHPHHPSQSKGCIRSDAPLGANDFIQPGEGDSETHCHGRLGDPQGWVGGL